MNSRAALTEVPLPQGASPAPAADFSGRMPALMGLPVEGAKRFACVKALLVGGGSIGLGFALPLARCQVAELAIVDPKDFKSESVLTHNISPEATGQSKAFYGAALAKRISPGTRVFAARDGFESLDLSEVARFTVVFLATDNLLAELKVSQACVALGIPIVQGSVLGEALCGHVRLVGNSSAESPCLACAYTREEWAQLNRNTVFSCEGGAPSQIENQPTRSLSSLCSVTAQLGILHFIRHLLGLGAPVCDTVLEYCAYTHATSVSKLTRNANCPCEHRMLRRVTPPRPLAQCSPRELLDIAALGRDVTLELGGNIWVEQTRCECGSWTGHHRFVGSAAFIATRCPDCGKPTVAHPFQSHRRAPFTALEPSLDRPLGFLDATNICWAAVRSSEAGALFLDA